MWDVCHFLPNPRSGGFSAKGLAAELVDVKTCFEACAHVDFPRAKKTVNICCTLPRANYM